MHLSSARDNRLGRENAYKTSETLCFWGFSLPLNLYGMSRNVVEICGYVASMQHTYPQSLILWEMLDTLQCRFFPRRVSEEESRK